MYQIRSQPLHRSADNGQMTLADCNKVQHFVRLSPRMIDMLISKESVYFIVSAGLQAVQGAVLKICTYISV